MAKRTDIDIDALIREDALPEEAELLQDLRAVGIEVWSVWELVNREHDDYGAALPILLQHLQRNYSNRMKEGIARALAVPEASLGWEILMREFETDPDRTTLGAKFGVACALAAAGFAAKKFEDLERLIRDPSHGESRRPLIYAFVHSKDSRIRRVLSDLVDDPDLGDDARWYIANPRRRRRTR